MKGPIYTSGILLSVVDCVEEMERYLFYQMSPLPFGEVSGLMGEEYCSSALFNNKCNLG